MSVGFMICLRYLFAWISDHYVLCLRTLGRQGYLSFHTFSDLGLLFLWSRTKNFLLKSQNLLYPKSQQHVYFSINIRIATNIFFGCIWSELKILKTTFHQYVLGYCSIQNLFIRYSQWIISFLTNRKSHTHHLIKLLIE